MDPKNLFRGESMGYLCLPGGSFFVILLCKFRKIEYAREGGVFRPLSWSTHASSPVYAATLINYYSTIDWFPIIMQQYLRDFMVLCGGIFVVVNKSLHLIPPPSIVVLPFPPELPPLLLKQLLVGVGVLVTLVHFETRTIVLDNTGMSPVTVHPKLP